MDRLPLLVEMTRGRRGHYETRHAGSISVVDGSGAEFMNLGDTDQAFPVRSAAKPFQLLPYLLDGLHLTHPRGSEKLQPDLAVMMASHAGEPMHTTRVAEILESIGLAADALLCGAHWPYNEAAREELIRLGQTPNALHSNCSGKHAGMLAVCQRRGWALESYLDPDHPLQTRIHDIIATLSCEPKTPLPRSVDGCSLPTYWLSIRGLARLFAALAYPQDAPPVENQAIDEALGSVFTAATRHPEMVGGTDRLDTRLMEAFAGRLFAKSGAAGIYAMGLAACDAFPKGLGIALKIEDGDPDSRVRALVACEILRQLGVSPEASENEDPLSEIAAATVRNVRGLAVGEYRPIFRLRQKRPGS